MEDEERAPKSVKASTRQKQGQLLSALLVGERGSGKSRFLIELHKMNVSNAYTKLGYGEKSDEEWKQFWQDLSDGNVEAEFKTKIERAARRCLMVVIDYDMEGQEQLLMRMNIMPPEIANNWEKWPVTGSPKDTPDEDYEHQFDEGHRALNYYLKKLRKHSEKYPEFASERVLVVEDCGEVANAALDHYFYVTTRGRTKDFAEHFSKTQAEAEAEGKHKGLFQRGQRDTFGMVNLEIKDFFHQCMIHKRDIGYNFYATARTATMKDRESGETKTFTTGKTYIFEGYLDLIMNFVKRTVVKKKGSREKVYTKFIIDTEQGAKNRLCPDFWMKNDGPRPFFIKMDEMRDADVQLGLENKEVKKNGTERVNIGTDGDQDELQPEEGDSE